MQRLSHTKNKIQKNRSSQTHWITITLNYYLDSVSSTSSLSPLSFPPLPMPPFNIQENIDLFPYNTFRVSSKTRYFVQIDTPDQFHQLTLSKIFDQYRDKLLFLWSGSNILFTQDLDKLVIKNNITTMRLRHQDESSVRLTVGWGYNRHQWVMFTTERGRWGLENLALIPGTVGASPIQNIGAYGTEVKDTIHAVKWFDLTTGNIRSLNALECDFAYRDSVFKHELKDNFFITHVTFKLSKIPKPNLSYPQLKKYLQAQNIKEKDLTPLHVTNAIIAIRNQKLPSINDIGTAGSFFKNPTVSQKIYDQLLTQFPTLKSRELNPHPFPVIARRFTPTCRWTSTTKQSTDPSPVIARSFSATKQSTDPSTEPSQNYTSLNISEYFYPDNVGAEPSEILYKLSAGQLLELSWCKGQRTSNIWTYQNHALVLVNYGEKNGSKIRSFAQQLQSTVKEKMGITLEPEVNII